MSFKYFACRVALEDDIEVFEEFYVRVKEELKESFIDEVGSGWFVDIFFTTYMAYELVEQHYRLVKSKWWNEGDKTPLEVLCERMFEDEYESEDEEMEEEKIWKAIKTNSLSGYQIETIGEYIEDHGLISYFEIDEEVEEEDVPSFVKEGDCYTY